MDIVIQNKSEKPIYEQIYEQIASQIITGKLQPNFCLPSIRVVATDLKISVITVKKAWELLEFNNFIYTRAGKGCFVADYQQKHMDNKKIVLAKEMLDKNLPFYMGLGLTLEELIDLIKAKY